MVMEREAGRMRVVWAEGGFVYGGRHGEDPGEQALGVGGKRKDAAGRTVAAVAGLAAFGTKICASDWTDGRTFAWYVTVEGGTTCTRSTVADRKTASRQSANASTYNGRSSSHSHRFVSNVACPDWFATDGAAMGERGFTTRREGRWNVNFTEFCWE